MKLSLRRVFESQPALQKLAALDLPVRTSYRLTKLIKKIGEEYGEVEKVRTKLVEKYGTKDEETGSIKVEQDQLAEFVKEFQEFLKTEIEIEGIDQVNVGELGDIKLSTVDVLTLEDIVAFD